MAKGGPSAQALWYVLAAMASNTMYLTWFIIDAKKQNQLSGDPDEIWILSNVNKMKEGMHDFG